MKLKIEADSRVRWNPARGFELDDVPVYVVGVNYVARYVCTNFWEDWRPEAIDTDFARMEAAGLNAVRIPIHWEYFEPTPGQFRPEALARLDDFMEMARKRGLLVMPWFLVGIATMSYDVSWREGRGFFTEPMLSHAANHLRVLVGALKRHSNILCWDICDEPEYYSWSPGAEPLPYNTARFHTWVESMTAAIRAEDMERAVTLGFGHIASGPYGMDIRRAAKGLDVMAVTTYSPHMEEDLVNGFRSGWFLGWNVRINDNASKGVFTCEAPGWSDIEASEENIARYYRVSLFSNLANGAQGVLPWVWNDFDAAIQYLPPMDKRACEKCFGISRADGTLKPAGLEVKAFAAFTEQFPPHEWLSVQPEAGVIVPVLDPVNLHQEFASLFAHYIMLRQAGLRVRYVWADELDQFAGRLLVLPNSKESAVLGAQWMGLKAWTESGGTLVSSSRHMSVVFKELFGVALEGRVTPRCPIEWGSRGTSLAGCDGMVVAGGNVCMQLKPVTASVLAVDQEGRPMVTRNESGRGLAFQIACAPECAVEAMPPEELARYRAHELFRGIAGQTGLCSPVICPDPRVELDVRRHADGRILAVAINHSRFPVKTQLHQTGTGAITPIELDGNAVMWMSFEKPSSSRKGGIV